MIKFIDVHKVYSNNKGIKGISFILEKGKPMALLGRNGAGKSTTIKAMLGILSIDSGKINIDENIDISYLPEERGLYNELTVKDNINFFAKMRKNKVSNNDVDSIIEEFQLKEYYKTSVKKLSKGNMQKVQLAIALMGNSDLLVLDEPFSGLDPVNRELFVNILKNKIYDKYVIMSSHQLDLLSLLCSELCILNEGIVKYTGSITNLLQQGKRKLILKNGENIIYNKELENETFREFIIKNEQYFENDSNLEIKYEYPTLQEMYVNLVK